MSSMNQGPCWDAGELLAEVKRHGELKLRHYESLALGSLLQAKIYYKNSPHTIGQWSCHSALPGPCCTDPLSSHYKGLQDIHSSKPQLFRPTRTPLCRSTGPQLWHAPVTQEARSLLPWAPSTQALQAPAPQAHQLPLHQVTALQAHQGPTLKACWIAALLGPHKAGPPDHHSARPPLRKAAAPPPTCCPQEDSNPA
jgi:hypothetical protein